MARIVYSLTCALLLLVIVGFAKSQEEETHGNGLERADGPQDSIEKGRTFPNAIKECIQTCRRLLFRGDKDLNYCIEGCRIRIYRKIYECVYDQCNEKGQGIPAKFSREQYHQCVYLCKVKPKVKPTKAPTVVAVPTVSTGPPTVGSTAKTTVVKESSKLHFIPLEYHYFNDKRKKTQNDKKNSLN